MSALVQFAAPATEPLTLAEVRDHLRLDIGHAEPAPQAPSIALAGAGAGSVDNGSHRYLVTFVTAGGETEAGTPSVALSVVDKIANGKVSVTAIPLGGSAVTARKLYRTQSGGGTYLLLATLADNSTTSYTDNTPDSALGAGAPAVNTTTDPLLNLLIASARSAAEAITRRALVTQSWDLYLDAFPPWRLELPKAPLQSVDAITYVDTDGNTQPLDPALYLVDPVGEPGGIAPAYGLVWPVTRWQRNAVKVRFTCGYGAAGAVPQGIKGWMLMRIATLFENPAQIVVGPSTRLVELPSEFVDGLIADFRVDSFDWAVE